MKTLKSRFFTTVLLLTSVFVFFSCDKADEEWRVALIEYPASVPVQPNGVIKHSIDIGSEWIVLTGSFRYHTIEDIKYKHRGNGSIDIYSGSFIRSLTLKCGSSLLPIAINGNEGGLLEDYKSNQRLQQFFNAVVESIKLNGYARIFVDGNADPLTIIDIDICIELDAYVIYD